MTPYSGTRHSTHSHKLYSGTQHSTESHDTPLIRHYSGTQHSTESHDTLLRHTTHSVTRHSTQVHDPLLSHATLYSVIQHSTQAHDTLLSHTTVYSGTRHSTQSHNTLLSQTTLYSVTQHSPDTTLPPTSIPFCKSLDPMPEYTEWNEICSSVNVGGHYSPRNPLTSLLSGLINLCYQVWGTSGWWFNYCSTRPVPVTEQMLLLNQYSHVPSNLY